LYDSSGEKGSLRGSIAATLQKKLLVNAINLLFELLGRTGSREAISAAGGYLGGAFYQVYRALHRASGSKDTYFALPGEAFSADAVDAQMHIQRAHYAAALGALTEQETPMPAMDNETLSESYPGLMQSVTQVLHTTEEQTNALLGQK
jgi:hypothetical protein